MLSLCLKQLWWTIGFYTTFSISKFMTLNVCPTAVWLSDGTTVAGAQSGSSGSSSTLLDNPYDTHIDDNNTIYVADSSNLRVQRFLSDSTIGTTIINGNSGSSLSEFRSMDGINVDATGNIYILDRKNHRITKWISGAASGVIVAGGNGRGINTNQLNYPSGMFVELNIPIIWIADTENSRIVRWESSSTIVVVCGSYGVGAAQFKYPFGLFVDTSASNTLYVADTYNHRIQMWLLGATDGTTVAGQTGGNGYGLNQLWLPSTLLVDTNRNMYIADTENHRIMRWTIGSKSGVVIAGSSVPGRSPNQLYYPFNIRFDQNGSLLVVDSNNNRIQKFSVFCASTSTDSNIMLNSSSTIMLMSTTAKESIASIQYYPKWFLLIFSFIIRFLIN